jgi:hypothetical protein
MTVSLRQGALKNRKEERLYNEGFKFKDREKKQSKEK